MSDLFNIPGDTGGNWRRHKFVEYVVGSTTGIDTVFLNAYADFASLDLDERVWLAFLHSCCNAEVTAVKLYEDLDFRRIKRPQLDKYWEDNKSRLVFISDRVYVKNMNWFCSLVETFITVTKRMPYAGINKLAGKGGAYTRHDTLYKELCGWKFMGRFSTELFIEGLTNIADFDLVNSKFSWKQARTMASGMLHILYEDEAALEFDKSNTLDPKLIPVMQDKMEDIIDEINEELDTDYSIAQIAPKLCSWRKMFKRSGYGLYYIDRQLEHWNTLAENYPDEAIWKRVRYVRRLILPEKLRGEMNGYKGIRKEKLTDWVNKGLTGVEKV